MSRRNKKTTPKGLKKTHASQPDIAPEEAAAALREEIIDEVKLLAQGKISSVYGLVGKGKELIALESDDFALETTKAPTKTTEPELTEADL